MTLKLTKSQVDSLPFDFEQAVRDFIAAKEAHRFTGDTAPTADPLVEAAVARIQYPIDAGKPDDFVADYEIEVDTPPPEPEPEPAPLTLEQRKQTLVAESRQAEQAAIAALMPEGKRRLLGMDYQMAMAVPEADRSPDQLSAIARYEALAAQDRDIRYAAARREAEIDDIAE
jgi:hypothetical protein